MADATDVSVLIYARTASIARTMRLALRGMNVRSTHVASDRQQLAEGFSLIAPDAVVIYVDGPENDDGLETMLFLRRDPASPARRIPIVAASARRDLVTVNAVINAGGHEYVLFPASGDALLKKITAARTSTRPFIEHPKYVGPCRRRRPDASYTGPERRAGAAPAAQPPSRPAQTA